MITTVTGITALGVSSIIGLAAVIPLVTLLTIRELALASSHKLSWRIARFVSVGILPLVIAFTVIIVIKFIEVL
ncbi:hypothetical protein ACFLWR_02280 [Chloroflexota bacterium]